jgi:prepilin-type N-terminal cleavage/methylation domain-containing protein
MKITFTTAYSKSGNSLVELMIVIAIISILAALAYPDVMFSRDRKRLMAAVNEYHMSLLAARTLAITKGTSCRVQNIENISDPPRRYELRCQDALGNWVCVPNSQGCITPWDSYSRNLQADNDGNTITFNNRGTSNQQYTEFWLTGERHADMTDPANPIPLTLYRVGTPWVTGAIVRQHSTDNGATWH